MQYKSVTYLNNFPHPIHGSLQPLRLGGEMLIDEKSGETAAQAWDRMHADACQWADERAREILANSSMPVTSRPPAKENAEEQARHQEELEGHLETIKTLATPSDIELYLKKAPLWLKYHEGVREIIQSKIPH